MPNDPSPAPAPAPAPAPSPAPAPTPAAFDWTPHVPDEAVRGWVTAKGFKDPGALAQSALNQEKLLGVPADQVIKMPKPEDTAGWNAVYDKLGRPKEAKDYGLPVPEGDKGEFAAVVSTWFHEAGLSAKQGKVVAEKWNAHVAALQKADTDARAAKEVEEGKALKAAWGPQFDQNVKLVDAAAKAFGMTAEQLTALKQVMGPSAAMKFVHAIGAKMGVEGDFVIGDGKPGSNQFSTPEAAKARIEALKADKAWTARWIAGGSEERAELRKLHQQAFPGDTVL